ncbi:hypothetical protein Tco_0867200 [Tanacetum coccineum]
MPLRDPNTYVSDSTFSGGGDDEGSAAANSVVHALADGDRGIWCTAEGSAEARCSSSSSSSSSFSTSSSSLSSSDDSLS